MSHVAQIKFVKLVAANMPQYFNNCKVLEIGSLDINGSVRGCFAHCDYVGIDVAEGKSVDVVCQGQNYDAPDNTFDQVICCEAMEHNPYWLETFQNMVRICKPGGLILMTCATKGRKEHGTTRSTPYDSPLTIRLGWEYYLNLQPKNFKNSFNFEQAFEKFCFWENWIAFDLYFCGLKKGIDESAFNDWDLMSKAVDNYIFTENDSKNIDTDAGVVARG